MSVVVAPANAGACASKSVRDLRLMLTVGDVKTKYDPLQRLCAKS